MNKKVTTYKSQFTDIRRLKVISKEVSKAGLRGKINAKCCECIYDPSQRGTWLKQVELCTSKTCSLYTVRPISKGNKHAIPKNS